MDFLATKGTEYLLIIGYLLLLVPFWWLLRRATAARAPLQAPETAARRGGWFTIPNGLQFHRGHSWVLDEGDNLFRVGIDDFARHLLGRPTHLELPRAGERVEQGARTWKVGVDGREIDMLSPLSGKVEELNPAAVLAPELVGDDPYGDGWLFKVRTEPGRETLNNLLPTRLVRSWMEDLTQRLGAMAGTELGPVMQDGGLPVSGLARQLAGDDWAELAAELLLTSRRAGPAESEAIE